MSARRSRRRKRLAAAGLLLGALLALPAACQILYDEIGGDFEGPPSALPEALDGQGRTLLAAAFDGIEPERVVDHHVHIAGLGTGGAGTWVNPTWRSIWHPVRYGRLRVYLSASGVGDPQTADADYVERLASLARGFPAGVRFRILALGRTYRSDATADPERTTFHVPNARVFEIAEAHPGLLEPVPSVHPYRPDALEALERWAARGARCVKWLPNAMRIDPSDARLTPYYDRMRELGLVLLTHTGDESSVEAEEAQHLGNPLRLRLPLSRGLRVVALHAASSGSSVDYESPDRDVVPAFELFLRLMDDPRYEGLLFGEISAITFFNHLARPLRVLLEREDLHPRLVNGSDYPLPGADIVVQSGRLADHGFLSEEEAAALEQVYAYNPLLFDFVLKRTVRHPETGRGFSPVVFTTPEALEGNSIPASEPRGER